MSQKKTKTLDEDILFRCSCGAPEFFEVNIFHWEESEKKPDAFFFCIMAEPEGFWQRLKHLFKRQQFLKEVVMPVSDVKKLIRVLKRHI